MRIEVTTDRNIDGSQDLIRQVEAEIDAGLARFRTRLTCVEAHLGDDNADKGGATDKRCMLQARPGGRRPVVVTHRAETLELARRGALRKLQDLLERSFGRQRVRKGGASIRYAGLASPAATHRA